MKVEVGSQLVITEETPEFYTMLGEKLTIMNPDWVKRKKFGLPTPKNLPQTICLFTMDDTHIRIPYGWLKELLTEYPETEVINKLPEPHRVNFHCKIPLYDYQKTAVDAMVDAYSGILKAPAGSGKTQMGIALAARLGVKTLWLTHTKDLLSQSKARAELYMPKELIGTITDGKVNIGKAITFATVQTVSMMDLLQYRNEWDCIIVDECHNAADTPIRMRRFGKVLNNLAARHKYGLSATVHRGDGLILSTFILIGQVAYEVPVKEVADKIMPVAVAPIACNFDEPRECFNTDGTYNFTKWLAWATECPERNELILRYMLDQKKHNILILSDRREHLKLLMSMLPPEMQDKSVYIDSQTTPQKRVSGMKEMSTGKKKYLFATYSLAKEGLDVPRLDRLFMVTPRQDYAVIVQSLGRIARISPGKKDPIAYDFVDAGGMGMNLYKKRSRHYRKNKNKLIEVEML